MEEKIRQIAMQVFQQMQSKQQYGAFKLPNHEHNGIDTPRINPVNITGFSALPAGGDGVVTKNTFTAPSSAQSLQGNRVVFTLPIIYHGFLGAFEGGLAPAGTAILVTGGASPESQLYINIDGTDNWAKFQGI